jgi:hypothetical protein
MDLASQRVMTTSVLRILFNSHSGGWNWNWVHSARRPLLAYCTCPGWLRGWRIWWNEDWRGKPKYSEKKNCPSATLSTRNLTWPEPGGNPGRRGGKPATNRLSYGAVRYSRIGLGPNATLLFALKNCQKIPSGTSLVIMFLFCKFIKVQSKFNVSH